MKRLIMFLMVVAGFLATPALASADTPPDGASCQSPHEYEIWFDVGQGNVGDTNKFSLTVNGATASWTRPNTFACEIIVDGQIISPSAGDSYTKPDGTAIQHMTVLEITASNSSPFGSSCGAPYQAGYDSSVYARPQSDPQIQISTTPSSGSGPFTQVAWAPVSGVMICWANGTDSDNSFWSSFDLNGGSHTVASGASLYRFQVAAADKPTPRPHPVPCASGQTGGYTPYCQDPPPPPPPTCQAGYHLDGNTCVQDATPPPTCGTGYHLEGNSCVMDSTPPPTCSAGYHLDGNTCVQNSPPPPPPPAPAPSCSAGFTLRSGQCVDVTPPGVPSHVHLRLGHRAIRVLWSRPSGGATKYEVCAQRHGSRTVCRTTTRTSYLFTRLSPGRRYAFKVRAYDQAGNRSGWSHTTSAVVRH